MQYKLTLLELVLTKHQIAIHWTQPRPQTLVRWRVDLLKWGVAEERRLKQVCTDENAERDLEIWGDMLEGLISEMTQQAPPSGNSQVMESAVLLGTSGADSQDP
ncbi:hypothetical protein NDU88_005600 [Pleurodeles waltl]|uniref:Uncharacterized protein n=1 Tax=Pleurodeles waltl TaxID=8319 RepID=A0AAV7MWU4_PLEWA|nr:hypothetical protein NDU88_005600 [Pleurodeles waltl]